jgi:hypothetical protein
MPIKNKTKIKNAEIKKRRAYESHWVKAHPANLALTATILFPNNVAF